MTATDPEAKTTPVLKLPAILDLTQAAALKAELLAALAKGDGLDLDAGDVQRLTSPCAQVLASAVRAFAAAGGPSLVVSNASQSFHETVCGLALCEALGIARG